MGTGQHGSQFDGTYRFAASPLSLSPVKARAILGHGQNDPKWDPSKVRPMNNSNSTDTSKTTGQQTPFVKKGESNNDPQPAKVEEPKPSADTAPVTGEPKQSADDASGKSLR